MPDDNPSVPTGTDDELLAWLGRVAAEADPVPEPVRLAARAAIACRDLDGELAVLLADSTADPDRDADGAFEPVRGALDGQATRSRMVSFEGGGVRVDLELSRYGERLDLVGQLIGAAGGGTLEYLDGEPHALDPDDLGRFLISGVAPGILRVRCVSTAGVPVSTSWIAT
jgi:hypothetical protein